MSRLEPSIDDRIERVFLKSFNANACKTDRHFVGLFVFQWLLGIVFAFTISPRTWSGRTSSVHIHVPMAIFLGALIASAPIFLSVRNPGAPLNRMANAVAQMFFSILFIHLTGGRIETHFHIFGSLAFLSFYRDWRPVALATVITATDHLVRGLLWPESVYGILSATPWRAFEHAAWVVFEDACLFFAIQMGRDELFRLARSQVALEDAVELIEQRVDERTRELADAQRVVLEQQQSLVNSSKMSALGEMASGIAHEINNPLTIIMATATRLHRLAASGSPPVAQLAEHAARISQTSARIARIIKGMKALSRHDAVENPCPTTARTLVSDVLDICNERFRSQGVDLRVALPEVELGLECIATQIEQVLLNLINNAADATEGQPDRWIQVTAQGDGEAVVFTVADSGPGIPAEVRRRLMQPFFTTKPVGKGTGLGLSISKSIVERHGGALVFVSDAAHTTFRLSLPKSQLKPLPCAA